jgi:nicotinamide mononucleotide transporter
MGLFIFFSVMQLNSWKEWIITRRNINLKGQNNQNQTTTEQVENWQRLTIKKFVTVYVPLILVATVIIGFILYQLKPEQSSKQLLLDSFTSAASLFAQYLMGKKVVECWLLWNVVNLATVIFSIEYTTINIAILYGAYMISATFGYIEWLKNWKATHENH